MLAELVFLTRFLGLTHGERPVLLRAGAEVQRIELLRDGVPLRTLSRPPWQAMVDFGSDLGPYELTAVGYGADGREVARDAQLINLARPAAEALIFLERSGEQLAAKLLWSHVDGKEPVSAVLKLDGKVVSSGVTAKLVPLGAIRDNDLHVVSGEVTFRGGPTVRKEIVFGGIYSEQMPAELTAIAVTQRGNAPPPSARCIRAGGKDVAPVGIEQAPALVAFIANGGTPPWVRNRNPRSGLNLGDAELHAVFPVLRDGPGAEFFTTHRIGRQDGLRGALSDHGVKGKKQFAEAVAASGMRALRLGRRRAVVHVLGVGEAKDESAIDPVSVRRYLARIGVPLRVWSLSGPRPELAPRWGDVEDVSTPAALAAAADRLTEELSTQRIAWIPAAPLDAYRATATPDCAYQPLGR